jgi:non-reducing end alpha-L-arabinofuranosidase
MVSACGAQDLNGGLLLQHDDAGAGAGSLQMDVGTNTSSGIEPDAANVPQTGGSGGEGGASCSNVVPCGGDVVGAWTVTSSCLKVSGQVDLSILGLGCTSVPVTGSIEVTGTWTSKSGGAYLDNTTTSGYEVLSLPDSCLDISGTRTTCGPLGSVLQAMGYAAVSCTSVASGGCTCSATVDQKGSMGLVSMGVSTSGTYKTSGNLVTINGEANYPYCVSGNTMTLTPQTASPTTTGAVIFQRNSTGGTGGSPGSGGATGTGGSIGSGGSTVAGKLPCDVYAEDGGPCVAAHSTVRALSAAYHGPLYQVRRIDGTTKDVPFISPAGFANISVQDAFCGDSGCTISVIYDQSGMGNHLTKAPPGGAKPTPGNEADATALPTRFSGHNAYGLHIVPGIGYRNNNATGTALGDNPETIYMVADGKFYGGGCCFDYGNAETNSYDNGNGAAEAVYFGNCSIWGKGAGNGPWVMGDLENGLWPGNGTSNDNNTPITFDYVTAMVKGDKAGANHWSIKAGNAQSGSLTTKFDGQRPAMQYNPMKKEGAIVLGTAGDNSNQTNGNFFEGLMTAHYSSDTADNAVQANIVSVYGQ